jgi:hypothetical protein
MAATEVRLGSVRQVVAAGVTFVDDLAAVDETGDGRWKRLGSIRIAGGRCVAFDR